MNNEDLKELAKLALARYLKPMPFRPLYQVDSQTAERYAKDQKAYEESNFSLADYQCTNDIIIDETNVRPLFSTRDCMTAEAHKEHFSGQSLAQLLTSVAEIRAKKENANNAKPFLSKMIDAETKAEWVSTGMVTRSRPNRVFSWKVLNWEDHEALFKSKIAVLDLFMQYQDEIIQAYEIEIAKRKQSPKKEDITKKIEQTVKKAEKVRQIVIKANGKAQIALTHDNEPDLTTCLRFIEAKAVFDDLTRDYSSLLSQLSYYANDTLTLPSMPNLTIGEISAEHAIKRTWRENA